MGLIKTLKLKRKSDHDIKNVTPEDGELYINESTGEIHIGDGKTKGGKFKAAEKSRVAKDISASNTDAKKHADAAAKSAKDYAVKHADDNHKNAIKHTDDSVNKAKDDLKKDYTAKHNDSLKKINEAKSKADVNHTISMAAAGALVGKAIDANAKSLGNGFIDFGYYYRSRRLDTYGFWSHLNNTNGARGFEKVIQVGRRAADANTGGGNNPWPILNVEGKIIHLIQTFDNSQYLPKSDHSYGAIDLPDTPEIDYICKDITKKIDKNLSRGSFIYIEDTKTNIFKDGEFNDKDGKLEMPQDHGRLKELKIENGKLKITVADGQSNGYVAFHPRTIKNADYWLEFEITLSDKTDHAYIMLDTGATGGRMNIFKSGKYKIKLTGKNRNGSYYSRLHFYSYNKKDTSNSYILLDNVKLTLAEPVLCTISEPLAADKKAILDDWTVSNLMVQQFVNRRDFVGIEVWDEAVVSRDFVYFAGCVNSRVHDNFKGFPVEWNNFGGANSSSNRNETYYSLLGEWESPKKAGRGIKWSSLPDGKKKEFINNPINNMFYKNGILYQTRWRWRVIKGPTGGYWENYDLKSSYLKADEHRRICYKSARSKCIVDFEYNSSHNFWSLNYSQHRRYVPNLKYPGVFKLAGSAETYLLPLFMVDRKNGGVYHPTFNPNGRAKGYYNGKNLDWYELPTGYINSIVDCFDKDKIGAIDKDGKAVAASNSNARHRTGTIESKVVGTPERSKNGSGTNTPFYNVINNIDVEVLYKKIADKNSLPELLARYKNYLHQSRPYQKDKLLRGKDYRRIFKIENRFFKKSTGLHNCNTEFRGGVSQDINCVTNKVLTAEPSEVMMFNIDGTTSFLPFEQFRSGNDQRYHIHTDYRGKLYYYNAAIHSERFTNKISNAVNKIINTYTIQPTHSVENVVKNELEIFGDIRKVKDRISFETKKDWKTTVYEINYVLCTSNEKNKGTKNHVYRLKTDKIKNINTDGTTGSANKENGHIDFSDTHYWQDLGDIKDVGELGGYPEEWLKHGIVGTPRLNDDENGLITPASTSSRRSSEYFTFPFRYRMDGCLRVLVSKRDGSFVKFDKGNSKDKFKYNYNNSIGILYVNKDDSWKDLGYKSAGEMEDLAIIMFYYTRTAPYFNYLNKMFNPMYTDKEVIVSNYTSLAYGGNIYNELLRRVPKGGTAGQVIGKLTNFTLPNISQNNDYNVLTHTTDVDYNKSNNKDLLKYSMGISIDHSMARLDLIGKEIRWTTNGKKHILADRYIRVNGKAVIGTGSRSWTCAIFTQDGILRKSGHFDCYGDSKHATELKDYINSASQGDIVCIGTYDEPRSHVYDNSDLIKALKGIGATEDIIKNLGSRSSYALIGIKNGNDKTGIKLAEDYAPRYGREVHVEAVVNGIKFHSSGRGYDSRNTITVKDIYGDDNTFKTVRKNYYSQAYTAFGDQNGNTVLRMNASVDLPILIKG